MSKYPLSPPPGRRVTVLLALFNGEAHLSEQLQSYLDQTLPPMQVYASDDSSGPETAKCFDTFVQDAKEQGRPVTRWICNPGPRIGLTANFLHLLSQVPMEETDYVALSDQDDIWLPEKLEAAVSQLATLGDRPVLLGTRSWEWNSQSGLHKVSRPVPEPYNFQHALMQNFAGGNTMVLNREAMALVQEALIQMPPPALHDWWLYQLITGAGGLALFDPAPRLLYRQHSGNQVGANANLSSKLQRFLQMLGGTYRGWMNQNLAALSACQPLLTPEACSLLQKLQTQRDGPLSARLDLLWRHGLHRKGKINQAALWVAASLKKM